MAMPSEPQQPAQPDAAQQQAPQDVHPSVKVRLADALAHVENFFARHPELESAFKTELMSGLAALERLA